MCALMTKFSCKSIPFFSGLPDELLAEIDKNSKILSLNAGHLLLNGGKKSSYLMIVLKGTVLLNDHAGDGRVVGVSFVGSYELLAWLNVIDNKPLSQTIITASACELLICSVGFMQDLVKVHATLACRFLTHSADCFRRLEHTRAMLNLPNAFHRVFVQIDQLSTLAQVGKTGLPNQQDIANSVNTSRETVSRALNMLIKSGVLLKVGQKIVVNQPEKLKQLAIDGPDALAGE